MKIEARSAQEVQVSNSRVEGVTPIVIDAINPTGAEIEKLRGFKPKTEPVYLEQVNGIARLRIDFYAHTAEIAGFERHNLRFSIFISKENRTSQSGKIQGIDAWGNTKWLPENSFSADGKGQPFDAQGQRFDPNRYRKAYTGEEALAKIIRAALVTPSEFNWDNASRTWSFKSEYANEEANYLNMQEINTLLTGNIALLKNVFNTALAKNNYIWVLMGTRTSDDGRVYEDTYTRNVASASVKDPYAFFRTEFAKMQTPPANRTYNFGIAKLITTTVTPTDMSKANEAAIPAPEMTEDTNLPF